MIKEYDKVVICKTGKTGIVVDVRNANGLFYLVEMDDDNEILNCAADEIEKAV